MSFIIPSSQTLGSVAEMAVHSCKVSLIYCSNFEGFMKIAKVSEMFTHPQPSQCFMVVEIVGKQFLQLSNKMIDLFLSNIQSLLS